MKNQIPKIINTRTWQENVKFWPPKKTQWLEDSLKLDTPKSRPIQSIGKLTSQKYSSQALRTVPPHENFNLSKFYANIKPNFSQLITTI